ncbi:hypothetical protein GCM10009663_72000 [Kitasatospora arboriphila]|uniref:Uncharacterized protein n=1 Tax=Kitasatospora arboriphila TaxID=258052 RepID=A0ABN1U5Q5_9ACTN
MVKRWQWWMIGLWAALMLSGGLTVLLLGQSSAPAPAPGRVKCPVEPTGYTLCAFGSPRP